MNVITLISPESPNIKGFSVSGAVRVTAFGLKDKESVTFKRVQYQADKSRYERSGCSLISPTEAQVSTAVDYKISDCAPSLNADRNTIIIPYAGSYIPEIHGDVTDLVIQVESISGTQFDDKEKGIDPCGLACKDEEWNTTGAERCNQHFVEQEEISNCGNIRWVRTEKRCGYSASIPLLVHLDGCEGCGSSVTAYLFHPSETRDPDANIAIEDCDGVVGYAYPTAGDGHTIPLEDCEGNIVGYAINQSTTAPQWAMC